MKSTAIPPDIEAIASGVIECAFRVHRNLGAGLLESVYETCLCHELRKAGFKYVGQAILPVVYDTITLDPGLRLDLLVEDQVIVELKAVEMVLPVHQAQLLTYLKLSGKRLGLLINFNTPLLKDGIRRLVL
jgi:GxxExxY protein